MVSAGETVVFVIDDDSAIRDALDRLLRSVGHRVEHFETSEDFLAFERPAVPSCLILDVRLPGASGLEFQRRLRAQGDAVPIIFITGHGDVPMSVGAMKAGAIEFLMKPFRTQELLDAVYRGLEADRAHRDAASEAAELQQRFAQLTPREREIMAMVVAGRPNKQIAHALQLSEVTIKVHRAHVMDKMHAASLPALVRMADRLDCRDPV